jgi:hypothetical protein
MFESVKPHMATPIPKTNLFPTLQPKTRNKKQSMMKQEIYYLCIGSVLFKINTGT